MSTIFFILLTILELYISLPICKEGKNFCTKCNPVSKLCEKCSKEVLIPDEQGGCKGNKKCFVGKNYCSECSLDYKLCKQCNNNFYADENGGCSFINNCEISSQGDCIKCAEDFVLVGTSIKICKSLNSENFLNCDKINTETGLCEKCKEGFYLNSGDKKCIKTNNCEESSYGVCTKCSMSYYLDKSVEECKLKNDSWIYCKETVDGKNCDTCEDGGYFDDEGKCIGVKYCSKEAPFVKCKKCNEGYYLAKYGNCCSKEPNCYFGDKDLGICTQCIDFYYIDFKDGKCKPNNLDNDFKYCTKADGECYQCVSGAYLGEDKKCSLSRNCAESKNGICTYCITGYHLGIDNLCNNIDKCLRINNYNSCEECEKGYYFNITSNQCEEEKEGFENCVKTDNLGVSCYSCRDDFYIDWETRLCHSNLEKNEYYKCALVSNGVCFSCISGYYLGSIDKKCSLIEGCDMSENEDKCLLCDSNLYCLDLKNGKCADNEYITEEKNKFYYRCNVTNEEGTKCAQCIDDYKVNNEGLCVNDEYCDEFDLDGNCKKCIIDDDDQYYHFCLNNHFDCVITGIRGCELCNNVTNFDSCDKCRDGFILENNDCIENE